MLQGDVDNIRIELGMSAYKKLIIRQYLNLTITTQIWLACNNQRQYIVRVVGSICFSWFSALGGVYVTPGRLSLRSEFTTVPSHSSTFVYIIPPQNVMPARITPEWVHPSCCTGARISPRYYISQRYHVNTKRPQVSVWNQSAGRLERVAHAHVCNFESYVYFINMKCTFK